MTGPSHAVARLDRAAERSLSPERLGRYRRAARGDLRAAVRLYEWNAMTAAALFEVCGYVEVVVRNALHDQLVVHHGRLGLPGQWFDDPGRTLDLRRHQDIAEARRRLRRDGKPETPGRVVAELSFGFWRFLLDKRYQATLWAPALQHAFPHLPTRRRTDVYDPVVRIVRLRNRIAHHEPVYDQPLAALHRDLLGLAAHVDPDVAHWIGG